MLFLFLYQYLKERYDSKGISVEDCSVTRKPRFVGKVLNFLIDQKLISLVIQTFPEGQLLIFIGTKCKFGVGGGIDLHPRSYFQASITKMTRLL